MLVDYINFHTREERTKYIFEKFQKYFGKKVLDIGCDIATLKKLMGNDVDYTGIDIAGEPDIILDLEKIGQLPFNDNSFDCVICADVLEHLENLHLVFSELFRVTKRYLVISWPNCWVNARVPIYHGYGSFKHYGLPVEKPQDRHKWFFSLSEAKHFVREQIRKNGDIQLVEERVTEKPRLFLRRWLRRLRYPSQHQYLNRYAHTLWTVIQKPLPEIHTDSETSD